MFFELSNEVKTIGNIANYNNPKDFDVVAFDQHYDGGQYIIYVSAIEK
jgi:hypothetical protein